ncbi:hypothetical protein [Nocardia sp. NPDC005366]|uniref:hypothetical protein n=1 Tax=Nocardia sp. NPDC005366 TaxID=3156878 RepID=UPI0033AD5468
MSNHDDTDFADRYLAQWNEPDAHLRRTLIHDLWSVDGAQILLDPPRAMRYEVIALDGDGRIRLDHQYIGI